MEPPARNVADVTAGLHPPAPRTAAEAGLSDDLLTQLVLKQLFQVGDLIGTDLAKRLGLEFSVIEPTLEPLRLTHQIEIVGSAVVGAPSYRYRISDEGRRRTQLFLEQSNYSGVAPVPLRAVSALPEGIPRRGADDLDARSRHQGVLAPGAQPAGAGPGGNRRGIRSLALRLRSAWKRQDGHRPGARAPARRRDRDPARHRGGRAHRPAVRSGQPRAAAGRGRRRRRQPDRPTPARRALGAVPPAHGHSGRRAEPRRRWTWPTRPSRDSIRRRFRPWPPAACW